MPKKLCLPGGASVGGAGASSTFSVLLSSGLLLLSVSVSLGELSSAFSSTFSSLVSSFSPSSTFSSFAAASFAAFFLRKLKLFLKESFFLILVARESFFFSSLFSSSVSLESPSPFSPSSPSFTSSFSFSSLTSSTSFFRSSIESSTLIKYLMEIMSKLL